jgi:hypothetical protein
MKLTQAVPVIMMVLIYGSTLTSLPVSIRLAVVGLMVSVVMVAVLLKRREDRAKPDSTS